MNIWVDVTKYCLQDLSSDLKEDWCLNTRLGTIFEEGPVMQMQWTQSFLGISKFACEN